MLHLSETTHNMYDEEHEFRAVSKSTPDRHDSWKSMLKKTTNEEQKKEEKKKEKEKKRKKREKKTGKKGRKGSQHQISFPAQTHIQTNKQIKIIIRQFCWCMTLFPILVGQNAHTTITYKSFLPFHHFCVK